MELRVWIALVSLCVAGGLMPGPAVMLVTTSAMRYRFGPAMLAALGVCAGNLLWIALAVSGAAALARALPSAFLALKVAGVGTSSCSHVCIHRRAARRGRRRGTASPRGLAVQPRTERAVFGGPLPAYRSRSGRCSSRCSRDGQP
jgi:homoserine/homoserine lactone efflux protein